MTPFMRVVIPALVLLACLNVQVATAQGSDINNVVTKESSMFAVQDITFHPTKKHRKKSINISRSISRIAVQPKVAIIFMIRPRGPYQGISSSVWKGNHYYPKWELVRKCIVKRESGGSYRARSSSSTAAGAYQFIRSTSNSVAIHLLHKPSLAKYPASAWSRLDQDRAFWALWNNGKGRSNWYYGAGYPCF